MKAWSRRPSWAVLAASLASSALAQVAPASLPTERHDLEGAIAGRVCADLDLDRRCSDAEPGIAGIRLVLETGQQVLTDSQGRYHLAGVSGRAPDRLGGGRLLPGRHRLRLDDRALAPGTRAAPSAVTIELPMGSLVRQDFALTQLEEGGGGLIALHGAQPASTRLEQGRLSFAVTGRAAPGDRVTVQGRPAEVDGDGGYRARLELLPGENWLNVTAASSGGAIRFFRQRVDVVRRSEGLLVIPRELQPTARVQLPVGAQGTARTGSTALRVRGTPGTKVSHPASEAVVDPEGAALLALELRPGENVVLLRIEQPGQPPREERLTVWAAPRPFAVGLLDLEGSYEPRRRGLRLFGRGAAHAEHRLFGFELSGDLELRDQDLRDLVEVDARVLGSARRPERLERSLDPGEYPIEWADDSVTLATNPAEGRLRLQARSEQWGTFGFGTHRASFADAEVGRYQRELFGPNLELHTPPTEAAQGKVRFFFDPGIGDPTRELGLAPAHEELRATGGSLYYLGSPFVAQGSEVVRVVLRDGLTGLPLREVHLSRGRDYDIDYRSGRILLVRPLSFAMGEGPLRAEPPTSSSEPVLVVDYERVLLAGDGLLASVEGRRVTGGEVGGRIGAVHASLGAVQEQGRQTSFRLLRGQGSAPLGPLTLFLEAAHSDGAAFAPDGFALSGDGGLSFARPSSAELPRQGSALGIRLRGPGLTPDGWVDAAFRRRSPGFSDGAHFDRAGLRQLSLRAEQPLGSFRVGLLADDRVGADPRDPFGPSVAASRVVGASVGWQRPEYALDLEARDAQLSASPQPGDEPSTGGRTSLGLAGRYRISDRLTLLAGHQQVLAKRGEGLGAFDDSFSSAGADLTLGQGARVGLRGGWGPRLGPQVWGHGEVKSGREVRYGGYSVDVDGPHWGERRAVSGARTEALDGTAVFVEDVSAHDASALRLSRAVGLSQSVGGGLEVTGRYERGVRQPLPIAPLQVRDAAGLSATWVRERVRAYGRAEVRFERGTPAFGAPLAIARTQRLLGAGGEVELLANLRASARLAFSDTRDGGLLEARFLEGAAGLAWRLEPGMVVMRYSIERELPPRSRGGFAEKSLQVLSLMPAVRLGDRFALSAGAHAGWSGVAGEGALVLSAALRPSVRVIAGLELAAEVARRSTAPDRGELTALRGEIGYRANDQMLLAVGYTAFGFSGLGLSSEASDSRDRVYLRAELAY